MWVSFLLSKRKQIKFPKRTYFSSAQQALIGWGLRCTVHRLRPFESICLGVRLSVSFYHPNLVVLNSAELSMVPSILLAATAKVCVCARVWWPNQDCLCWCSTVLQSHVTAECSSVAPTSPLPLTRTLGNAAARPALHLCLPPFLPFAPSLPSLHRARVKWECTLQERVIMLQQTQLLPSLVEPVADCRATLAVRRYSANTRPTILAVTLSTNTISSQSFFSC